MVPWARILVVLTNIIIKKHPLQHSRNLYYHLQQNHTSYTTSSSQTFISSQLENEDSTAIQNTSEILNIDDIHSCVTPQKKNISVQATSIPPCLTPLINTVTLTPVELPKTTQLPPVGKEYLCFQVNRNSPHAAQCVKSRVLNKAIDSILSIDTF